MTAAKRGALSPDVISSIFHAEASEVLGTYFGCAECCRLAQSLTAPCRVFTYRHGLRRSQREDLKKVFDGEHLAECANSCCDFSKACNETLAQLKN